MKRRHRLLVKGRRHERLRIVYSGLYKQMYKDGKSLKVFLVDGNKVRNNVSIDYTLGGHDKVYSYIPAGEVWLEKSIPADERDVILIHELHERNLMKNFGYSYNKAHEHANLIEAYYRKHPAKVKWAVAREMMLNVT